MTKGTRWKIDSTLKEKIALEALREQATVSDLAQAIRFIPTRFMPGRSNLRVRRREPSKAATAMRQDREREIERLHAGGASALRPPGKLQHRPGQPVHQCSLHRRAAGSRRAHLDGRTRALDGQRVYGGYVISSRLTHQSSTIPKPRSGAPQGRARARERAWSYPFIAAIRATRWWRSSKRPPVCVLLVSASCNQCIDASRNWMATAF
jgi:transposase